MNPFHVDKCLINQMISQGKLPKTKYRENKQRHSVYRQYALLLIKIIDKTTLLVSLIVLYSLVLHQERCYGDSKEKEGRSPPEQTKDLSITASCVRQMNHKCSLLKCLQENCRVLFLYCSNQNLEQI